MNLLLPFVPLLPALMLLALISPVTRGHVMGALWLAPLPALLIAPLAIGTSLVFYPVGIRITLLLDAPGALLLGGAALLWRAARVFARAPAPPAPRLHWRDLSGRAIAEAFVAELQAARGQHADAA